MNTMIMLFSSSSSFFFSFSFFLFLLLSSRTDNRPGVTLCGWQGVLKIYIIRQLTNEVKERKRTLGNGHLPIPVRRAAARSDCGPPWPGWWC